MWRATVKDTQLGKQMFSFFSHPSVCAKVKTRDSEEKTSNGAAKSNQLQYRMFRTWWPLPVTLPNCIHTAVRGNSFVHSIFVIFFHRQFFLSSSSFSFFFPKPSVCCRSMFFLSSPNAASTIACFSCLLFSVFAHTEYTQRIFLNAKCVSLQSYHEHSRSNTRFVIFRRASHTRVPVCFRLDFAWRTSKAVQCNFE
jgi:hypothetical protein